jgi:hypothetical protein
MPSGPDTLELMSGTISSGIGVYLGVGVRLGRACGGHFEGGDAAAPCFGDRDRLLVEDTLIKPAILCYIVVMEFN